MIDRTHVHRSRSRLCWAAALVAALAVTSAPERAEAQPTMGIEYIVIGGIAGAAVLGVPTLLFTVGDIVSYANGTPYATGWAVLETVIASLTIATGVITIAIGLHGLTTEGNAITVAIGLIPLSLGGFNLGHAIWSFANLGSAATPSPSSVRLTPFVAPCGDGAVAGLGGSF